MKLARFGDAGHEKPGIIGPDGLVRDLSGIVDDIGGAAVSPAGLERIAALDPLELPAALADVRLGSCVAMPPNFHSIGLNYADHAAESNMPIPAEPILFSKATSSISGPDDDVLLPRGSQKMDWEVELGVVVGTAANYVSEADALSHVAGYCIVNDVSERAYQLESTGQWVKGKSAPTFGPTGPWLVTPDEIGDVQDLAMFCNVNGNTMQKGSTKTMIFSVAEIISYMSRYMTLLPGDLIATGTPPGVGMGMKPQVYLKAGDEMHLGIEGLGEQRQKVVAS